jgi:hypothetical protein
MTNLTDLRELRELLEQAERRSVIANTNDNAPEFMALHALGLVERYGCNSVHTLFAIAPLGAALLSALRDAERLPEVQRERDEARAAVWHLANSLKSRGHPCAYDAVGGWVEIAYERTGGTVPERSEQKGGR